MNDATHAPMEDDYSEESGPDSVYKTESELRYGGHQSAPPPRNRLAWLPVPQIVAGRKAAGVVIPVPAIGKARRRTRP